MGDVAQFWQVIGILITLVGIVCGSSVYFLRKNTERIEEYVKQYNDTMKDSQNEIKTDIKELTTHIDKRFENVYKRIDMNSVELKEFITNEVSQLKAKDMDQDIKLENTRERLTKMNEDLLNFKLEVSEKYQKKSGDK